MSKTTATEKQASQDQSLLLSMRDRSLQTAALRATIAEDEVSALRQQHLILKSLCEQERDKNQQHLQQIEQLNQKLLEKEKRLAELQKELSSKKPAERPPETEQGFARDREALQALREENALLSKSLNDSQEHAQQLERVIQFVRKRGEEAFLETKQLRDEFQTSQLKIIALTQQLEAYQETEKLLKTHSQDAEVIKQEKQRLEEALSTMRSALEEKELHLKMAQQHLAKKLKEIAIHSARGEELRTQLTEQQSSLAELNAKIASLQRSIDQQAHNEQELKRQLQESLKASELEKQQADKKYEQLLAKYRELEQQSQLFKAAEEKQKQVQNLLNNLTGLLSAAPAEAVIKVEEPKEQLVKPQESTQDIFDRPTNTPRRKQTLFE